MKFKVITLLFVLSLIANAVMGVKWYFNQGYVPDEKESQILTEMQIKTINSAEFKKIASREKVIALDYSIDKFKGGVFPYNMEISVRTDKITYLFSCADEKCSKMSSGDSETYSRYSEENPILPLTK